MATNAWTEANADPKHCLKRLQYRKGIKMNTTKEHEKSDPKLFNPDHMDWTFSYTMLCKIQTCLFITSIKFILDH